MKKTKIIKKTLDNIGINVYYNNMGTILISENGYLVMIHTRDHGWPHITIYAGNPKNWERRVKLRIVDFYVIENSGFSLKDIKKFKKELEPFRKSFQEEWDEIKSSQED